jgi:ferritin-like metal-binding protein YciE
MASENLSNFRDLYLQQLRDLWDAEGQLVDALPAMVEAATDAELKRAFEEHLEVTKMQKSRLEDIFNDLGEDPEGHTCAAMKGLIKEGNEVAEAEGDASVRDAGLIAAAQRIEHYEISGYGTARTFARRLNREADAELLQKTLDEEGATDKKLTSIAERDVNVEASEA